MVGRIRRVDDQNEDWIKNKYRMEFEKHIAKHENQNQFLTKKINESWNEKRNFELKDKSY
jgi:hypothetical protein